MSEPGSGSVCPRCGAALTGKRISGVDLKGCEPCASLLVEQSALMPALSALSDNILDSFDADAELQALPDRSGQSSCPGCGKAMEKVDYCGAKLVYFDRCDRCDLLWIGNEELGAMSLMWARMEKRIARTRAENENDLSGMDVLLNAASLKSAVARALRNSNVVEAPFFGRVVADD
jgi:Zn-finger nucleic acid-binding protein